MSVLPVPVVRWRSTPTPLMPAPACPELPVPVPPTPVRPVSPRHAPRSVDGLAELASLVSSLMQPITPQRARQRRNIFMDTNGIPRKELHWGGDLTKRGDLQSLKQSMIDQAAGILRLHRFIGQTCAALLWNGISGRGYGCEPVEAERDVLFLQRPVARGRGLFDLATQRAQRSSTLRREPPTRRSVGIGGTSETGPDGTRPCTADRDGDK